MTLINRAAIGIAVRLVFGFYFIHRFLFLCQPLPRAGNVGVIEVLNCCLRERLAKNRHDVLPLLVSDHRAAFNVGEMFGVELDFFPKRSGFPAMKSGHVEQHAQLPVLPDEPFELRHEARVIRLRQNSTDVNGQKLSAVAFI
jgi:hypothetical protein